MSEVGRTQVGVSLKVLIADCMLIDQRGFNRALARAQDPNLSALHKQQALASLTAKISVSIEKVQARQASIPKIEYPEGLPVSAKREDIAKALLTHQVLVLAGNTGSGKTTQLPKICLDLGFGAKGLIGHTQPRRIAARAVATRIAEEINSPLGDTIGYQVRFTDSTSANTLVKLMTDGILLAEIQQDRFLSKYEVLIIDEAHERSLNIDFLLGYLRELLTKRKNLKLIITSATIDVEKFSKHFDNAPIVEVSGRSYPVDILYRPLRNDDVDEDGNSSEDPITEAIFKALNEIGSIERSQKLSSGDVLVFLSGEREIRDVALSLRKMDLRDTEILPLYARLTPAEQNRIFAAHRGRRIILSTNVAETSLTVPGIVYVIDTGLARISRYSVQSKVQRLPIERVSQASANQRAGRCGRVSHGICFRLYSEEDFLGRSLFTDPEIQRTNLSAVILQMLVLGLGDIQAFPFLDKPEIKAINDGFKLLYELEAIDNDRRITQIGRQMAFLPADPRLCRMLIEAAERTCLQELLIIVSALSVQDPKEAPPEKRQAAREMHQHFSHPESDFLSWVLLWVAFEKQRQDLSQNALRQYCKKHYLSYLRMREWRETHRQLHLACQQLGFHENYQADATNLVDESDYEAVHRAILSGSLNQLGMRGDDGQYIGSRGRKFAIFPTSSLAKKGPKWLVTTELIETSRLYATLAARIEAVWAVDAARNLVRRDYFEPHWEKSRGQVMAFEKISLFGLVLIEKQRIAFAQIDPGVSREIFIREGLVAMNIKTGAAFFQHNKTLLNEVRKEEEKLRRPGLFVNEERLFEFYSNRIPLGIYDMRTLDTWLKTEGPQKKTLLHMRHEDLLEQTVDLNVTHYFPDSVHIQNNPLPIRYAFKPGEHEDGAIVDVPADILVQMREQELDWMIPGLIRDRCVATLKGLPKHLRKQFIPVPDFVDEFMQTLPLKATEVAPQSSLFVLLREYVKRRKNIQLDMEELQAVELPPHLRPYIRVLDKDGKELGRSHSLTELQIKFCKGAVTEIPAAIAHPIERSGIHDWDFGVLNEEVFMDEKLSLKRYPALVDQGDSVAIVLQETSALADNLTRKGLVTLFIRRSAQQKRAIQEQLKKLSKSLALKAGELPEGFEEQGIRAIYELAFATAECSIPRDKDSFERALSAGKAALIPTAERFVRLLAQIAEQVFILRRSLHTLDAQEFSVVRQDIATQLDELLGANYLSKTPVQHLQDYPRYLKAISIRLEKLASQAQKDTEYTNVINRLKSVLEGVSAKITGPDKELELLRWALQELRVSLFAQGLGTRFPVSEKRLLKRMQDLKNTENVST